MLIDMGYFFVFNFLYLFLLSYIMCISYGMIVNCVADLTLFDTLGDNGYFILHRVFYIEKTDTILQ